MDDSSNTREAQATCLTRTPVEVMRLYSNLPGPQNRLQRARLNATAKERAPESAAPRLRMKRLDAPSVAELIDGYRGGAKIKDLAQRFGVHRTTVTCLLRRHGVQSRPVGLSPGQIDDATRFYREGWSLAKLGDKFGVDDMTVRRYLLLADVAIRSPHERPP
jgi:hypothetical protein